MAASATPGRPSCGSPALPVHQDQAGNRGDAFTPIINPPEIAILGVGRITDQPAPAEGGITWRKSMTLSLTVDHRGVDGAPAARFLAAVADRLQDPAALL